MPRHRFEYGFDDVHRGMPNEDVWEVVERLRAIPAQMGEQLAARIDQHMTKADRPEFRFERHDLLLLRGALEHADLRPDSGAAHLWSMLAPLDLD